MKKIIPDARKETDTTPRPHPLDDDCGTEMKEEIVAKVRLHLPVFKPGDTSGRRIR
jgi:hypothetical protein